jgi:hypothetical protein
MTKDIARALDLSINEVERQLSALRAARAALEGTFSAGRTAKKQVAKPAARRRRRKFTAAQRAEISRRMKAAWARRKAGRK